MQSAPGRCAVRQAANEDEKRTLDEYLDRQHLGDVVEYSPGKDHELDAQLCSGRFERVIFAGLDALLIAIWKGGAHLDQWAEAGVRIELAVPLGDDPWTLIDRVYDSLTRWRDRQRRRQIIAATILSALALLAMCVLFFLVLPDR